MNWKNRFKVINKNFESCLQVRSKHDHDFIELNLKKKEIQGKKHEGKLCFELKSQQNSPTQKKKKDPTNGKDNSITTTKNSRKRLFFFWGAPVEILLNSGIQHLGIRKNIQIQWICLTFFRVLRRDKFTKIILHASNLSFKYFPKKNLSFKSKKRQCSIY